MIKVFKIIGILSFCAIQITAMGQELEKLIFIRHGEKLKNSSLGQLNCQGLNRSLKLPNVLINKFGKPDFIFAPNPSIEIGKDDVKHSYVRPLATIEPTAIKLEMPINTQIGYNEVSKLVEELLKTNYKKNTIFISWEHKKIVDIVTDIYLKDTKNKKEEIPKWPDDDFDSIYILSISEQNNSYQIKFKKDSQQLNNLSQQCP
ncbi:hypothetical protein QEJ31_04750 [Pigmentibacter sp. JX0631]|uniref:hypothetical protein n=1 Tax=Pigmentibacter sp. JX0631 TaxID=2976982 RepID=UPI0024686CF6|nr:hypothetical protein [Pigmentibacter sp. JX0631]WGL60906.1 hypothetical protein QEJ31_04750 [Pigmentibacter sp. JX0631]